MQLSGETPFFGRDVWVLSYLALSPRIGTLELRSLTTSLSEKTACLDANSMTKETFSDRNPLSFRGDICRSRFGLEHVCYVSRPEDRVSILGDIVFFHEKLRGVYVGLPNG